MVAEVRSGHDSRHREQTEISLGTWQIALQKAISKYLQTKQPSSENSNSIKKFEQGAVDKNR